VAETVIIAAAATGSGKTLITAALLARMRANGVAVAAAKTGPDYIDPAFLAAASGRPCLTLDPWAMGRAQLSAQLSALTLKAEMLLIEGVMGLFDGAPDGAGSTAELAAAFRLPVIVVLDAARQGATLAAIAHGLASYRPDVSVAGFILNRVSSPRHGERLAAAIEAATGRPVIGLVPPRPELALPARHLGLVQAMEHEALDERLARAGEEIGTAVSLCRLANLARPPEIPLSGTAAARPAAGAMPAPPPLGQRVAVAHDAAFGFTYAHWLEAWQAMGAEILPFSPLADEGPAEDADAVFLPGGYPELHAGRLAAARQFREGLHRAARRGALIYGECGGFMALGQAIIDEKGQAHEMTGLLPLVTSFARRRLHLGYREMRHEGILPWPERLTGHEFHYTTIAEPAPHMPALFTDVRDATGAPLPPAGLRIGRVCGSYLHVIAPAPPREERLHPAHPLPLARPRFPGDCAS
jgi:cobyrinic acid a,c-diamide synthase